MDLWVTFAAVAVAVWGYMTAWFVVARLSGRTDVVDTAWGLGFIYVVWLAYLLRHETSLTNRIPAVLVSLWGVRLAVHIARRNFAKSEDDHRYQVFREQWKPNYWLNAYLRIFLLQGVLLLLICSTAVASVVADKPAMRWAYVLGCVIWLFGITFEAIADYQLKKFVETKKPGEIMKSGLWRYSRHPNYFGEITAWWGAAVVGLSLQQWWAVIGAAVITLLITKISGVPLLEQHYAGNRAFQEYKQHTSVLIPLPRR